MDDDETTREQAIREAVARGWCDPANSHKEMDVILAESIVREVCALESRSEVLTNKRFAEEQAERIVNSADAQCFRWLVKHHSGSDGKRCFIGGVDFAGDDIHIAILDAIDREESHRAEPSAPTLEQDSQEAYHFAEREPDHAAEPGKLIKPDQAANSPAPGPASAAPEVAAPVTRKEPEPLVANRDGTAAAYDIKRIILDAVLAAENEGRARGFAEGLEEAAKVCEGYYDEPDDAWRERQIANELAAAIRAKIKPTMGS